MTETILILDTISEEVAKKMRDHLPAGLELDYATELGDDHLVEIIGQADYAISGQVPVSGRVLRAAKRLKLVHKWGVGVDNFDLDAAKKVGFKTIFVKRPNEWGHESPPDPEPNVHHDFIVESFTELPELLKC